jgi:hypothetical protein
VGLGRGLGLPDRSCQEVLFCFLPWFLPVVRISCSVKMSRSQRVQEWKTKSGAHASGRRLEGRGSLPESSTAQLLDSGFQRNKARMSMKTKDKIKMSGSADRRFCCLRLFHDRRGRPRTANTVVRATPKSAEQSENVYENKRQ